MDDVIELGMFRLKPGVDRTEFLVEVERIGDWLRQRPGYLGRELLEDDDGQWVDVIRWSTIDHARAAFNAFERDPTLVPFIEALDPDSMRMMHARRVTTDR